MVILDCEKMKYPNTGLFFFCDMLAKALVKVDHKHELGFYVPSSLVGRWGDEFYYKRKCIIDKIFMTSPGKCKLWHTTFQLAHYVPVSGKVLLTVHDLNFLYEKTGLKQKKYMNRLQNLVDRSDRIVAISEFTKKDLLDNIDVKGKKVDVIYNGCNVYDGPVLEPKVKPEGEFLFTVGTVLPKKNFHVLPCLLKGNDYKLVIAGNKSNYVDRIMDEAREWGVEDRVQIVGPVEEYYKHWYLKNCKAFVFPSIAEGFGLPVIEAMDYGKPVFISRHTCLPEIGGDFAYYFNMEFDREKMIEEFNAGMNDFLSGGKSPDEISAYARTFSWEHAAERYWKIYNEMIEK